MPLAWSVPIGFWWVLYQIEALFKRFRMVAKSSKPDRYYWSSWWVVWKVLPCHSLAWGHLYQTYLLFFIILTLSRETPPQLKHGNTQRFFFSDQGGVSNSFRLFAPPTWPLWFMIFESAFKPVPSRRSSGWEVRWQEVGWMEDHQFLRACPCLKGLVRMGVSKYMRITTPTRQDTIFYISISDSILGEGGLDLLGAFYFTGIYPIFMILVPFKSDFHTLSNDTKIIKMG